MSTDVYELPDGGVFRVRPNRVLVRFEEAQAESAGGILIPERSRDPHGHAEVLAVGELRKGTKTLPPPVRPGERVIALRALAEQDSNPTAFKLTDGAVLIRYDDIIGVLEP